MQAKTFAPGDTTYTAEQLLAVATEAAAAAESVVHDATGGRGALVWEEKGSADFVTQVDKDAEIAIVETIQSRCPGATVIGEELSPERAIEPSGLTFVVDPLDGTTNFLHGYPEYSVSIAVIDEAELIAGVVRNLTKEETFTAIRNQGSFLNGKSIHVSRERTPARALIGTGFPFKQHDLLEQYARQFVEVSRQTAGIRRAGSAALDLSNLACGRFDGFWELVLAPWDIAAGVLIVREAGGIVSDLAGNKKRISHGAVVAGNPAMHPWLLEAVGAAEKSHTDISR